MLMDLLTFTANMCACAATCAHASEHKQNIHSNATESVKTNTVSVQRSRTLAKMKSSAFQEQISEINQSRSTYLLKTTSSIYEEKNIFIY